MRRWAPEEDAILLEELQKHEHESVMDFSIALTKKLDRTRAAISSRLYEIYREEVANFFVSNIPLVREVGEKQISFDLVNNTDNSIPKQQELDNRAIFKLYDELSSFKSVFDSLKEENEALKQENESLRSYYALSEKEIVRLKEEAVKAIADKERAIDHLNSVQKIVTSLSYVSDTEAKTPEQIDETKGTAV